MALIVKVYINQQPIIDTHCVRIKGGPGELCTYKTGEGEIIHHYYDDGAEGLAMQLLRLHREKRLDEEGAQ